MFNASCVETLTKEIALCDPGPIGNFANECMATLSSEVIKKLTEQVKASCSDSDAVATILYYLDLCERNISNSPVFRPIAPVVPGMSCLFDPRHAFSLVALLPGEFLTGFMDGLDENITSAFLKRFLDSCVNKPYLQAVIRCLVLSLTDSVIGLGRLAAHMYTEYLVRGELDEELPYWPIYLWNTLAAHLIVNGILFFSLEVMKAYDPENWKKRFSTQFLRMRFIPQIPKVMLTYAWGGCRMKGVVGYLVNVVGQIAGHMTVSRLCLRGTSDDYNASHAAIGARQNIQNQVLRLTERMDQHETELRELREVVDRQQGQIGELFDSRLCRRQRFFGGMRDSFSSAWSNTREINFFNVSNRDEGSNQYSNSSNSSSGYLTPIPSSS